MSERWKLRLAELSLVWLCRLFFVLFFFFCFVLNNLKGFLQRSRPNALMTLVCCSHGALGSGEDKSESRTSGGIHSDQVCCWSLQKQWPWSHDLHGTARGKWCWLTATHWLWVGRGAFNANIAFCLGSFSFRRCVATMLSGIHCLCADQLLSLRVFKFFLRHFAKVFAHGRVHIFGKLEPIFSFFLYFPNISAPWCSSNLCLCATSYTHPREVCWQSAIESNKWTHKWYFSLCRFFSF